MDALDSITGYWDAATFESARGKFKKLVLSKTCKIYFGASFRPNMELSMGENTFIGTNAAILVSFLKMADGSQINAGSILFGRSLITIGKNSVLSYHTTIGTTTDTIEGKFMNDASAEDQRKLKVASVSIGDNCFVGANSIIMPGVKIGSNSVIGAGSYIDSNIPNSTIIHPKQQLLTSKRVERIGKV